MQSASIKEMGAIPKDFDNWTQIVTCYSGGKKCNSKYSQVLQGFVMIPGEIGVIPDLLSDSYAYIPAQIVSFPFSIVS